MTTLLFPVFHPAAALYAPANRKVLRGGLRQAARAVGQGAATERQALATPERGRASSKPAHTRSAAGGIARAGPLNALEQLPLW